jgi:WD40 repeat protein
VQVNDEIINFNPNLEAEPQTVAFFTSKGLYIATFDGKITMSKDTPGITSICWSRKGKQIACALSDGSIQQIKPNGQIALSIPADKDVSGMKIKELLWLETKLFVAMYVKGY